MNIRIPRSGNAARIAKSYLQTLGVDVSHSQSLELIARLHGYASAQAMQSDARFASAPTLHPDSSGEYTLVAPKNGGAWITVESVSVHITKAEEGVEVNLYRVGQEHEPRISVDLPYQDAAECCPEPAAEDDPFVLADAVKKAYLLSGCSRHDVSAALEALNAQCKEIFPSETAMWEFLMEEAHEDNEPGETLVLVYGDTLENFQSVEDAQRFVQKNLPDLPDRAFWEDEDCKELTEVDVTVDSAGKVVLSQPLLELN